MVAISILLVISAIVMQEALGLIYIQSLLLCCLIGGCIAGILKRKPPLVINSVVYLLTGVLNYFLTTYNQDSLDGVNVIICFTYVYFWFFCYVVYLLVCITKEMKADDEKYTKTRLVLEKHKLFMAMQGIVVPVGLFGMTIYFKTQKDLSMLPFAIMGTITIWVVSLLIQVQLVGIIKSEINNNKKDDENESTETVNSETRIGDSSEGDSRT